MMTVIEFTLIIDELNAMVNSLSKSNHNELLSLMNVGVATCEDLHLLGITTIAELAKACPDELYLRLQKITNQHHDPCVWDIFAAAINESRTGQKLSWWKWTQVRKKRQADNTFVSFEERVCK